MSVFTVSVTVHLINVNCETKSTDESANKMQSYREKFDSKLHAVSASLKLPKTTYRYRQEPGGSLHVHPY